MTNISKKKLGGGAWVLQKQNFLHSDGEGGAFFINLFLDCQEKRGGSFIFFHLFF
jgi:hypothetical protein